MHLLLDNLLYKYLHKSCNTIAHKIKNRTCLFRCFKKYIHCNNANTIKQHTFHESACTLTLNLYVLIAVRQKTSQIQSLTDRIYCRFLVLQHISFFNQIINKWLKVHSSQSFLQTASIYSRTVKQNSAEQINLNVHSTKFW